MNEERDLKAVFHYHPVVQADESAEKGHNVFKDELYVTIYIKGQKNTILDRKSKDEDKLRFPDAWKRFQMGDDVAHSGTLLGNLPSINQSLELTLKAMGIHTVEDLATLNDAGLMNIKGGRMLQKQAKGYLDLAGMKIEVSIELEDEPVDIKALEADPLTKKKGKAA